MLNPRKHLRIGRSVAAENVITKEAANMTVRPSRWNAPMRSELRERHDEPQTVEISEGMAVQLLRHKAPLGEAGDRVEIARTRGGRPVYASARAHAIISAGGGSHGIGSYPESHESRELMLHTDNTQHLHRRMEYAKQALAKKIVNHKEFDPHRAHHFLTRLSVEMGKDYAKEYGGNHLQIFDREAHEAHGHHQLEDMLSRIKTGEYDHLKTAKTRREHHESVLETYMDRLYESGRFRMEDMVWFPKDDGVGESTMAPLHKVLHNHGWDRDSRGVVNPNGEKVSVFHHKSYPNSAIYWHEGSGMWTHKKMGESSHKWKSGTTVEALRTELEKLQGRLSLHHYSSHESAESLHEWEHESRRYHFKRDRYGAGILTRKSDFHQAYFQPGDEASQMQTRLHRAKQADKRGSKGHIKFPHGKHFHFDYEASNYDDVMQPSHAGKSYRDEGVELEEGRMHYWVGHQIMSDGGQPHPGQGMRISKYNVFSHPANDPGGAEAKAKKWGYTHIIGPHRTKRGAEFMASSAARNNPHVQTADDADRIAADLSKRRMPSDEGVELEEDRFPSDIDMLGHTTSGKFIGQRNRPSGKGWTSGDHVEAENAHKHAGSYHQYRSHEFPAQDREGLRHLRLASAHFKRADWHHQHVFGEGLLDETVNALAEARARRSSKIAPVILKDGTRLGQWTWDRDVPGGRKSGFTSLVTRPGEKGLYVDKPYFAYSGDKPHRYRRLPPELEKKALIAMGHGSAREKERQRREHDLNLRQHRNKGWPRQLSRQGDILRAAFKTGKRSPLGHGFEGLEEADEKRLSMEVREARGSADFEKAVPHLAPRVIADRIADEVIEHIHRHDPKAAEEFYTRHRAALVHDLENRPGTLYRANPQSNFSKLMRSSGNKGRDALYSFMRHWASGHMKEKHPHLHQHLPDGYGWDAAHRDMGEVLGIPQRNKGWPQKLSRQGDILRAAFKTGKRSPLWHGFEGLEEADEKRYRINWNHPDVSGHDVSTRHRRAILRRMVKNGGGTVQIFGTHGDHHDVAGWSGDAIMGTARIHKDALIPESAVGLEESGKRYAGHISPEGLNRGDVHGRYDKGAEIKLWQEHGVYHVRAHHHDGRQVGKRMWWYGTKSLATAKKRFLADPHEHVHGLNAVDVDRTRGEKGADEARAYGSESDDPMHVDPNTKERTSNSAERRRVDLEGLPFGYAPRAASGAQGNEDLEEHQESDLLYQNGDHDVRREVYGRRKTPGFAVYRNGLTHATRVASIGYSGERGLQRAKEECDRREKEHARGKSRNAEHTRDRWEPKESLSIPMADRIDINKRVQQAYLDEKFGRLEEAMKRNGMRLGMSETGKWVLSHKNPEDYKGWDHRDHKAAARKHRQFASMWSRHGADNINNANYGKEGHIRVGNWIQHHERMADAHDVKAEETQSPEQGQTAIANR